MYLLSSSSYLYIVDGVLQDAALIPDDAPLPKLPVPPLQQTIERYLDAVRPLVPAAAYERTRTITRAFTAAGGQGPRLQRALEQRREETANWVSIIAASRAARGGAGGIITSPMRRTLTGQLLPVMRLP